MTPTQHQLGAPPPLAEGALRIVALGGLGEIGRNMTVFEWGGRLLIVDCGVLFPEDHQPGVDLILPDFEYIRDRLDDIEAIVLTHAHEDHIGAVPYLLREKADIPLIGSRLTLALVEAKLREHRITPYTLEVKEGQTEQVGPFSAEFVAVNHSIPDALAVAIRTPAGQLVLHTGDFKMDQLPLDGRITDLRAFARLGEEGVDLFLVDSTNAEVPGFVRTEREIEPVIDAVFARAERRVISACFASHVHRVQQILDTAHKHGRKVAFIGRSMVRNMGVARDLGYLTIPSGLMVTVDELASLPDEKVVLVCTGSQGEPMAALSRMANNDHPIKIGEGDTVLLASSLIPGNENAVFRVINGIARLGADVVHKGNALVHVSGHAAAGELTYCYNIVRPRNVMPVHGEWRHLRANGDLAIKTGVPRDRVILADDGVVVDLADGVAKIVGAVPCGFVYVDGSSVGDITESSLKDRRILGSEGFISVVAVVDLQDGKVVGGPDIHARGFAEDQAVFDSVRPKIAAALEDALREGTTDVYELQRILRRAVGKWVSDTHRRRPMIIPVVLEV
jgi:ribonuclease J